jgi:NitT/TauT family transport system ATP-binding protein
MSAAAPDPWLNVVENLALSLEARGLTPRERVKRSETHIDLMGLSRHESALPRELSWL